MVVFGDVMRRHVGQVQRDTDNLMPVRVPLMPMTLDEALAIPRRELDALLPVGSKWRSRDGYRLEVTTAPYPVFERVEVDVLTWGPTQGGPGRRDHCEARYALTYERVADDAWPTAAPEKDRPV